MKRFAPLLASFCVCAPANLVWAIGPDVIHTEITTHASSLVPGAKDAGGNPVVTNWLALEDLSIRHDGGQWMLKGRTTQATTNDSILNLGSGLSGTAFAQDGQPAQGGVAGEQYDFFDTPVPAAWDDAGNIGFSFRAKGGSAATFEKVVRVVGGVHTITLKMGDPALGLIDTGTSGDETFGNSINSVHLLNDGRAGFINTPITNLSSTRYPAFFRGNTSFRQSGVSTVGGGEVWDSFDIDAGGGTPDGAHWFAIGDTENPNTAVDNVFVVDDNVILREGTPIGGSGPVPGGTIPFVFARMLNDGDYFVRGVEASGNDWAVRNGALVAKTGDAAPGGELWGAIFSGFTGDRNGNFLLAGNTNNPNANLDTIMAYNGTTLLMREGDPIDLDNNGLFDDNVFLASFQPNDMHLTDSGDVYFLATLRNGAGTALGDAFLHIVVPEPTTAGLFVAVLLLGRRSRSRDA